MEDKIKAIGSALQPQQANSLDEHEIDLSLDYPEPKFTLRLSGVGTLPRGDIQAIKAKSKNGKSFLCTLFIASLFGCKDFSFEIMDSQPPVVLYFDTEQNVRNTAKMARRVHTLLGWNVKENHQGFHIYNMRTMNTAERLPYIEASIAKHKPTVVFIDGIADLIEDFNDVVASSVLVNQLIRISADNDCCVCCVLHTNKAKEDNNMKGHLGTMLLQKASDVYEVKKDGLTFRVSETDCRNQPIDDFAFSIDGHGIPYPAASLADNRKDMRLEGIKNILKECFTTADALTYTELVTKYQENGAVSERTAKRAVKDAKENGLISLTPNHGYKMTEVP